jgi:hypothetical protein
VLPLQSGKPNPHFHKHYDAAAGAGVVCKEVFRSNVVCKEMFSAGNPTRKFRVRKKGGG